MQILFRAGSLLSTSFDWFFSFSSRVVTATLDKTTENRLHDLVLSKFGLTPFLNTYPDFLAGAAVMVVALFIAAGLDHSKTIRRWINCLTCSALTIIVTVALIAGKWSTLNDQPFLFQGSDGVRKCLLHFIQPLL